MTTCSNPGCDQPGTNQCSACKTTPYCGPICQTADWPHHKEECPGHLRKVGMANLAKAKGYNREQNWPQTLRHADLAATKLKQLKDLPVEAIDEALKWKYYAFEYMGRHREALECAKEWYCLWPTKHTHPPAIEASFAVIQSCIHNKEFFDAALYARTLWETERLRRDSHIPEHKREGYTARGAYELARALWQLAEHGGMPAEEKQEAGREAIMLAGRALEVETKLYGTESEAVASSMLLFGNVLDCFNDVDDDEVSRLYEQARAIFAREQGIMSVNVASTEYNLGNAYFARAKRAYSVNDLDRFVANLELALPRYLEAARIYQGIKIVDMAENAAQMVAAIENLLRLAVAERAATFRS